MQLVFNCNCSHPIQTFGRWITWFWCRISASRSLPEVRKTKIMLRRVISMGSYQKLFFFLLSRCFLSAAQIFSYWFNQAVGFIVDLPVIYSIKVRKQCFCILRITRVSFLLFVFHPSCLLWVPMLPSLSVEMGQMGISHDASCLQLM